MKKPINLTMLWIFVLMILLQTNGFSQYDDAKIADKSKILITYMLEFREDSTNTADIRGEEMILFIGDSVSLFMSYNNAFNDTIKSSALNRERSGADLQTLINFTTSSSQPSRFRYRIYKNKFENTMAYHQYLQNNNFFYEEPLNALEWRIIPEEQQKILNYNVQKAVTYYGGRNWIAWFAPDIPINDGPYKFNGLPGLIVRIQDSKGHYHFTLTSFERLTTPRPIELIKHDNLVNTDRKSFILAQENFRQSIIIHAQDAQLAPESQRIASENMRRRNNPIELRAD